MFVDSSGFRSRVLRRIGLAVGVVCLAYVGVLGATFMGWGTSLKPSALLPFDGAPPSLPSGAPHPSVSAPASARADRP
ncbi:hypothetical protein [Streptomyces sp. NPDC026659]|uniref:hypothetical protein n=1 Tax=Streptomyces sp. NPDC026659 TaxID=3155123 RepID=UPI0033D98513